MGPYPVLALRESVIFPGPNIPLKVLRIQGVLAIKEAQKSNGLVVTISQKNNPTENHIKSDYLNFVGTLSKIEKISGNEKEGFRVVIKALHRFRVSDFKEANEIIFAYGDEWKDEIDADDATYASMLEALKELSVKILQLMSHDLRHVIETVREIDDLSQLCYIVASYLDLPSNTKQEILETAGLKDRALILLGHLKKLKDNLEVQHQVREKMGQKLGKSHRESILREQLKTIKEELGENGSSDVNESLREKIDHAKMPPDVLKVALSELKRLEMIGEQSQESHVIRNYLDLLIALPWENNNDQSKIENLDIEKAREILDNEHYGLEKIKKRIIEHLSVMKLKNSERGQILLLVGPPGVGKTSLGQSIAKAMSRKFVRGSLGGVRDDAEIRGHRRTYIGAMPGRIIQGLKRAEENNPVFMLDEIDKLSQGLGGDPASALLEVLDPEQNATFLDHYLDVPFDLSKVFFIATANRLDSIPGPLLDRMDIIDLNGYTTSEKEHIAKNHLIPKVWKEHGIKINDLTLSDECLNKVITSYTREAGVRDLKRKLVSICRHFAQDILSKDVEKTINVKISDLEEIFGNERFVHEVALTLNPPGVTTGLAWTPQGGEILFIEANLMPGKGHLILTGQLGDVMKESTQIALSLVRSRLIHVIPGFQFEKNDIHVHVPAGGIPKDGPSAGITMLTTIASLLTGRSVDPKLAMTGELTLRGAVMPVGGIKEKLIAAHRAGITKILLSKRNEKDLNDVPTEVREGMKIDFVETASEVLKLALGLDSLDELLPQGDNAKSTRHLGNIPAA